MFQGGSNTEAVITRSGVLLHCQEYLCLSPVQYKYIGECLDLPFLKLREHKVSQTRNLQHNSSAKIVVAVLILVGETGDALYICIHIIGLAC